MDKNLSVTRRQFFAFSGATLGMATLVNLSSTAGGVLFPDTAYADEGGVILDTYTLAVVAPSQVGVMVVDVTDETAYVAIEGATVTLKSAFNDKSIEATTDSTGRVFIDIADLAETTNSKIFEASVVCVVEGTQR